MSTQVIFDKLKNVRPAKTTKRDLNKVQLSKLDDISNLFAEKYDEFVYELEEMAELVNRLQASLQFIEAKQPGFETLSNEIVKYQDDIYELMGTDGPPELSQWNEVLLSFIMFDTQGALNSLENIASEIQKPKIKG